MPPDDPELAELGEDELLVVLEAGEDVEGAMVISVVGVYSDPKNVPLNEHGTHWSAVRIFVDTDMEIPAMRFQPTKDVLTQMQWAEQEAKKQAKKRKQGDYSP